jgi:hypothetical protein
MKMYKKKLLGSSIDWFNVGFYTWIGSIVVMIIGFITLAVVSHNTYDPYNYKNGDKVHHMQIEQDKYGFIMIEEEEEDEK